MKKFFNKLYKYRNYSLMIIVLVTIIYCGYEYYNKYFYILKNPYKIKSLIISYGKYGFIVFILLQIIQVIAFFIPGEIIQITGGYIYGTTLGSVLSLIGITIGSSITFFASYLLGKSFTKKIIPKKDFAFFDKIFKFGDINIIVLLLYLIPGVPKDVLGYICGIVNINYKNFLFYSTIGRIPGIVVSSYFGGNLDSGNNITLITIAVVMTILFFIGVYKGEKIVKNIINKN